MSGITLDQAASYVTAVGTQAEALTYFRPGGAFAVLTYAVTVGGLVPAVWRIWFHRDYSLIGWLIWVTLMWAVFIPSTVPGSSDKPSWVYGQMEKITDAITVKLIGEIDSKLATHFFDANGYIDRETAVTPEVAFPLQDFAERTFSARPPQSLHEKIHFLFAGAPQTCITRPMIVREQITQANLDKRHIDWYDASGNQTEKNCWTLFEEVQLQINGLVPARPYYEARTLVRRSVLDAAAAVPERQVFGRLDSKEPMDDPIWQQSLRIRLWLTSPATLGTVYGLLMEMAAVAIPFVIVSVFFKGGWWNLMNYIGFILAAKFMVVLWYLVHTFHDQPAFKALSETETKVDLGFILKWRILNYDAFDSAFFKSVDQALWRDTLLIWVCPVLAFWFVFKILLPRVHARAHL